jgi:ElaB/YqjD/DUF883 family membrane-anchored ribosome-binding protein
MAEKVHRSSDLTNFDTYPSPPPEGEIARTDPERPSAERAPAERASLQQRAAELGAAAGKIVYMVRHTRESVENLAHQPIYDRISGLAENAMARAEHLGRLAGDRAQELTHAARDRTAELGRQAREKAVEIGRQAKAGYLRTRHRAVQTVHKYPVQTAVAVGAAGFLLGVGLRIRRAKRAH